jgi:hypothetical protein
MLIGILKFIIRDHSGQLVALWGRAQARLIQCDDGGYCPVMLFSAAFRELLSNL